MSPYQLGYNAAKYDAEFNTDSDCPFPEETKAYYDWWEGYDHFFENYHLDDEQ